MTLSLTSPHFIRLQETKVNLLSRLVQNCKASIIRCYLHTYLLSYLPSYLPKYLPTYLHTLMPTCTYHYFCFVFSGYYRKVLRRQESLLPLVLVMSRMVIARIQTYYFYLYSIVTKKRLVSSVSCEIEKSGFVFGLCN